MEKPRLDKKLLDAVERTAMHITRCTEDAQQACSEVLEELDDKALNSFDGRSSFKTWLIAVTRNKAIDIRRKRMGRRTVPRSVTELGPAHHELFRLYFLESLPYGEVRAALLNDGLIDDSSTVADLLGQILDTVDPRTLHRIHWDRPAAMTGLGDGRLLEFHTELRCQAAERSARIDSEFDRHENRLHSTLAVLAKYRMGLPADERRVLEMKFDRNMTAAEIAHALGLNSPRRVYTMLDRSMRTLRRLLATTGLPFGLVGFIVLVWDFWAQSVQWV